MNIQQVVMFLQERPGKSCVALEFDVKTTHFGFYECFLDEDEPDFVCVHYEGGFLFDDMGEEDSFSFGILEDIPKELYQLKFSESPNSIMDMSGLCSEYAAKVYFPSLPEPDEIFGKVEERKFAILLNEKISELHRML
ncbi:MAG: hypothetical protein EOL98_14195 [Negativicutes bacterium]|nr:hypothetical protein [Negativicutes bacterium]